jgi:hypothetical protein
MAYKINDELVRGIAQLCLTEEWADVHFQVVVRLGEGEEEEEEVETEVLFRSFKVIQYYVRLLIFFGVVNSSSTSYNANLVKILDMVNNSNF